MTSAWTIFFGRSLLSADPGRLDRGPHPLLLDEWQRLEEKVRGKQRFGLEVNDFENYYLGRAQECSLDNQWRILIPPTLRKYANLQRDVVLVSAVEKFRVWDQETWNKVFADAEEKFTQNPESFGNLGL